ncbi:hypothetical protein Halha_1222 [Halobacteroides halobius DSM 5150]|uniref:Hemerythrin-like domain-containing protein n=1 Tax=Halobacteroides halobius (strain ATCC 35273 / DSM 5150 / MD-1) TaxID=748449 RepID=L0K9W3_HALHC|nr:hemerythrin domain-containing protein [Halobacteroides halobius]AGB41169.1 hypothetical protein Halha_1222 [Halobacteroides halobius DSM 5150]
MNVIELLRDEHDNIKRVLVVMRKLCIKILKQDQVEFDAFSDAIDFVRNYADKHHHGKEEDILFAMISDHLDDDIEKDPVEAMLSEHDLGRYFIGNLESALDSVKEGKENAKVDIIANAIAYADLLAGHIYKEDNIIYSYAEEELSQDSLQKVHQEGKEVEATASEEGLQEGYINLVNELEAKVKDIKL